MVAHVRDVTMCYLSMAHGTDFLLRGIVLARHTQLSRLRIAFPPPSHPPIVFPDALPISFVAIEETRA